MPQNNVTIPEWMKLQNDYSPKKDRDGFLTKTLLSFMRLFRFFNIEKNESHSIFRAGFRTLLVFGLIILSALSRNIFFCGTVAAGLLLYLSVSKLDVIKRVLGTAMTAAFFTALIMLPSFFIYNSNSVVTITFKVFLSTGILSLYSLVTPWNKITAALRFLKIPSFMIFILELTIHYIFILGNAAYDMLLALKLRSVGKNQNKEESFSGILGTVFLKSIAVTEETQQAMECRLYDGTYVQAKTKIKISDFLPILILIFYIFIYVLTS